MSTVKTLGQKKKCTQRKDINSIYDKTVKDYQ